MQPCEQIKYRNYIIPSVNTYSYPPGFSHIRKFSGSGNRSVVDAATDVRGYVRRFDRAHIIATFDSPRVAAVHCGGVRAVACKLLRVVYSRKWLKNASRFLLQRGTTPHTLARARRWRSNAARENWSTWYGQTMAGSPSRYATSTGTPSGASTACRPNRSACWTTSKYCTRRVCIYIFFFFVIDFDLFVVSTHPFDLYFPGICREQSWIVS